MANDDRFNWVQARVQCNVSEMFEQLRAVVELDVKSAVECGIGAEIDGDLSDRFSVRVNREPNIRTGVRTFSIEGDEIGVVDLCRSGDGPVLVGCVGFDGKDCLIEVDRDGSRQCLRPWEFSRMALEPLFFPEQ